MTIVVAAGVVTGGLVAARQMSTGHAPAGQGTPKPTAIATPSPTHHARRTPTQTPAPTQETTTASPVGTAFDTDLSDGRYIAYLRDVDQGTPAAIRFDLGIFLTGDAANRYAASHGMETPVPNDNIIVNDNPKLRLMPLAPDAQIEVIDYQHCGPPICGPNTTVDATRLAALLREDNPGRFAGPFAAYWLTIQDHTIVKIQEQYSP
jgi:hypothetical protein